MMVGVGKWLLAGCVLLSTGAIAQQNKVFTFGDSTASQPANRKYSLTG
jgi:hypothetical protein